MKFWTQTKVISTHSCSILLSLSILLPVDAELAELPFSYRRQQGPNEQRLQHFDRTTADLMDPQMPVMLTNEVSFLQSSYSYNLLTRLQFILACLLT